LGARLATVGALKMPLNDRLTYADGTFKSGPDMFNVAD